MSIPKRAGPFVFGVVFALVASPCASPVLVAVLTATPKDGSFVRGVIAMVLYAIGYTAVLFTAALFAGVAVASRGLLRYGNLITRAGAALLVILGVATIVYGVGLLRA